MSAFLCIFIDYIEDYLSELMSLYLTNQTKEHIVCGKLGKPAQLERFALHQRSSHSGAMQLLSS